MNMDYREPRNGDFASYVEELSRHFDMKEQAVNPDFTSGFPSQLDSIGTSRSGSVRSASISGGSGASRTAGSRQAAPASSSADTSFPVPASGTQHTGFDTQAAAPRKKARSFPWALVIGLIAVAIFILADEFGSGGTRLQAESARGPLIFILIILFIIFRRIRNAAKRFPTPGKTTKQI